MNCELLRNSQSELTAIWGLGSGRKRNGRREGKVTKRQSLVRMQPLAWKKKRFLGNHISHVPVTLTLSTPWMRAHLETIVCKFGRNRAICVVVEAICAKRLQTDGRTDRRRTPRDCISSCAVMPRQVVRPSVSLSACLSVSDD